jgi:hypothetical protein
MQKKADVLVLIAAVISIITALVPLWKWIWQRHLVRRFDAKKAHYNELLNQAKWFEHRAGKLDTLRKRLMHGKMHEQTPDRFQLSEMISTLDTKDAEWARKVEDISLLTEACQRKEDECLSNAEQCRQFAEDVSRRVLFW